MCWIFYNILKIKVNFVLKNMVLWAMPILNCESQSSPFLPWSFVSKITNPKHQITNKSQIPNCKFQTGSKRLFFCLGF